MSNLKYIPTKKIKEILAEPYCRGIDGAEYEEVKEELENILWARLAKKEEEELNTKLELMK